MHDTRAHLALATTITLLTSACPDRQLARVPIAADVVEETNIPLDDNRDIDILFVIDNSDSMKTEQDSLAANFPAIIDTLRESVSQPSVHFGVISTDVGGGEGRCAGNGDDGLLQTGDPSCNAINDGSSFLYDLANPDGTRRINYDGDLRDAFSCMAKIGVGGCGFEQPLEAVKRAIDNPANTGFFRDHAYLAIIFVTDEDDCSIADGSLLEDNGDRTPGAIESPLGPISSFRCFEFGVQCGGPLGPREAGPREDCIPDEDSPYLASVAGYIEHVRGSKRFPTQLFVAGIAGDLEPIAVEYRTNNIFTEFPIPQLAYSCQGTGLGEAVPPIRLQAFLNAFEGTSALTSLCQDDLTSAVADIATFLDGIVGPPCLQGELVDTSDEPGIQPDCSVVEVTNPGLESESEQVLSACDNAADPEASTNLPCFQLEEAPIDCEKHPSKLALRIAHPADHVVPPFTRAEVSCVGVSPL